MKTLLRHSLAAACLLLAMAPALAQRAGTLVVDGNDWMSASATERQAFLVGAADMIMAEDAYAKRRKLAAAPVGTQLTKGVGALTLTEIEARVTRYYQWNPNKLSTPVMGVLWQEFVKEKNEARIDEPHT